MKYVLAIDSFKGCISSAQAAEAAARGILAADRHAEVVKLTVSDGGEGMLQAFSQALLAETVQCCVHDAMMRRITASYAVKDETAIIEIAEACGLSLIEPENRNPLVATSYGVGELVVDAMIRGCTHLIIGLGGSGTSDCGLGMLKGMKDAAQRLAGKPLSTWEEGWRYLVKEPVNIVLASDVDNPLAGPQGAATVFGPQKGATEEMIPILDRRARTFAEMSKKHFGYDHSCLPGAGAAGGLGYGFMQYLDAKMQSGAELLLDLLGFDTLIRDADIIITGEGSSDKQTLMGKLPVVILRHAQKAGVPCWLIAGRITNREELLDAGFAKVSCINPEGVSLAEALKPATAMQNIRQTIQNTTTRATC